MFHFRDRHFPELEIIWSSAQFGRNYNPQQANGLCERTGGWHGRCICGGTVMNTKCGTYNLILAAESDEKGRSIAETLVYALLILSVVASIISAAVQSVVVPSRVAVKIARPNTAPNRNGAHSRRASVRKK